MEVPIKELRMQPGRVIKLVEAGNEVIVTYRGKPAAKLVPVEISRPGRRADDGRAFGMWKERNDMKDVIRYVENMRKGRSVDR